MGHYPWATLRAKLTEDSLQRAYINGIISDATAEEAMIIGRFRWSPAIYPFYVIADVIWTRGGI
jgi:hypothetical protein